MRDARANDYWRHVYEYSEKKLYKNYISKISFDNCNGFTGDVELNSGITVLCGLNGVGKSSLVANIKNILGLSDTSIVSKNKFEQGIGAKVIVNEKELVITPDCTLDMDKISIYYIDSDQAIDCMKYWEQSNMDEMLESEEPYAFSEKQIEELSELVGKEYLNCVSYEISDQEKKFVPVFFKITESEKHINYDSTGMGIGEHFIIYMYYILEKLTMNSILIIEEPESYISVLSQRKLMNYIAKVISEKKISVVLTSHSPHIINMVRKESVRIIIKINGEMTIYTPGEKNEAESILGIEYKNIENIIECKNTIATIFVEDYVARIFLECLLNIELPYIRNIVDIVSVGGESFITERLSFDDSEHMSHRIIGIYDADILKDASAEKTVMNKAKWPVLFLPVNECVEKDMFNFFKINDNIDRFCGELLINKNSFKGVLNKTIHYDHHDRFLNICKNIKKSHEECIKAFYLSWRSQYDKEISDFKNALIESIFTNQDNLKSIINSENATNSVVR